MAQSEAARSFSISEQSDVQDLLIRTEKVLTHERGQVVEACYNPPHRHVDASISSTISCLIYATARMVQHYASDIVCEIDRIREDFFDPERSGTSRFLIGFRDNGVDAVSAVLYRLTQEGSNPYHAVFEVEIEHRADGAVILAMSEVKELVLILSNGHRLASGMPDPGETPEGPARKEA